MMQNRNQHDMVYLNMLKHVLEVGTIKSDRTGTGTKSLFGYQMRFDLSHSFPLLTSKKMAWHAILVELLWMMRGETNILPLLKENVHIWSEWPYKHWLQKNGVEWLDLAKEDWNIGLKDFELRILNDSNFAKKWGELGPIYGKQWRNFNGDGLDQLSSSLEVLKQDKDCRRNIVTAWNPLEIEEMTIAGLPPCHCLFQFYVANNKLSCQLYQRSCDTFLGVPFNIASYSLLTMIMAKMSGLEYGEFVWTGGDVHIYSNHFSQVEEQIARSDRLPPSPKVEITGVDKSTKFEGLNLENFKLINYNPLPPIRGLVAIWNPPSKVLYIGRGDFFYK